MKLHEDSKAFKEIVSATAAEMNLEEFQVEKDYYVSLLLEKLAEVSPDIVFKGGTSLSKCYSIIDRFSEDVDINLKIEENAGKVTNKQKRNIKNNILRTIEETGFELLNEQVEPIIEIRSRRDFNKYLVGYKKAYVGGEFMVNHIIVETSLTYRAFPCEQKEVSNYITKFLLANNEIEVINKYNLQPFLMYVQTIDRTFIDKVFAICDYFEENISHRYSRHIYDIHMIWKSGQINFEELKKLVPEIIEVRKLGNKTHSCKEGYHLIEVLEEIISIEFYRKDYETNTKEFLSKEVSYHESINSLEEVIKSGIFPKVIK